MLFGSQSFPDAGLQVPVPSPVITPLEVYYDDTGCHQGADVFMWAGYLTKLSRWHHITTRWNEVLDAAPAFPYWHTSRARARQKGTPFALLDPDQVTKKEEALARIIADEGQSMVAVVVRIPRRYCDTFVRGKITFADDLPEPERKRLGVPVLDKPEFIGWETGVCAAVVLAGRMKSTFPVNFIYEDRQGDPYQVAAAESMRVLRPALPSHLARLVGSLEFRPGKDRKGAPLQAADMLAWHLNDRTKRRGRDDPTWAYLSQTAMNEVHVGIPQLTRHVETWNRREPVEFLLQ